jgi:hypothetical protein
MFKLILNTKNNFNQIKHLKTRLYPQNLYYFTNTTKTEQQNSPFPNKTSKPKREKVSAKVLYNHIKPYFLTPTSKRLLGYSLLLTILSKGLISMVIYKSNIVTLLPQAEY